MRLCPRATPCRAADMPGAWHNGLCCAPACCPIACLPDGASVAACPYLACVVPCLLLHRSMQGSTYQTLRLKGGWRNMTQRAADTRCWWVLPVCEGAASSVTPRAAVCSPVRRKRMRLWWTDCQETEPKHTEKCSPFARLLLVSLEPCLSLACCPQVLREWLPSGTAAMRLNIDATKRGNLARFFNHSCGGGNLKLLLGRWAGPCPTLPGRGGLQHAQQGRAA